MRKCNVCRRRFRLLAKNRYEVIKDFGGTTYRTYNAFDCPYCGCQNVVGIIEARKIDIENIRNKLESEE